MASGQLAEFKTPDYILLKILWSRYTSSGDTRGVPDEWRRTMMGLRGEGIAEKVAERLNNSEEKVLIPYHFALIKESTSEAKAQTALGAVAIYHYAGAIDKVKETCAAVAEVCRDIKSKNLKLKPLNDFEVITGVKVD